MAKRKLSYSDKFVKIREETKLALTRLREEEEKLVKERKKQLVSLISKVNYLSIDDEIFAGSLLLIKDILENANVVSNRKINNDFDTILNEVKKEDDQNDSKDRQENDLANDRAKLDQNNESHVNDDVNSFLSKIKSSTDYIERLRYLGKEFFRKKSKKSNKEQ